MSQPPLGDSTRVLHAGLPPLVPGQPFLPGPVFAAPFVLDPVTGGEGIDWYGRPHNASRRHLETAIGELEGGDCLAFTTGMAAIGATLLSLLHPGDTVVLPADGYFTTRAFARAELAPRGIEVLTAPTAGPYPQFEGVRLVLVETPANPGLDVCDLAELAAAAHAAGALFAVDNTTATPLGQRPLELGADLVVASGTKALTGHSDLLLGYIATRDGDLLARLRSWRDSTGGSPSPFDSWLAHRSLATLDLRLARQTANAAAVADVLAAHPAVDRVRWPGRPDDPAYAVASRQMARVPGVVTFDLRGEAEVARFLTATALVIPATSFGGLHTTADRRAQWGDDAPPGLVRLSCGVEDTADLVADITRALDAV
ncbi:cystathionine gamma-lyase [Luedemannella flava]|uniref:Cystathionine gamma-lyase n=1 Tax=Luedemannella flava TaxID=349316 RepID=A0ABP4YVK4_9ACTN